MEINELDTIFSEFYRKAVDEADIVSISDAQGRIVFVNDLFCKISQYSRQELIGHNHSIVKSGSMPHKHYLEMWKTISLGKVWRGEFCNKAKDGSLYWVDSVIVPFMNSEGKIEKYFSFRRDITQKKQLEKAIFQNDKMASIGEMASCIFHDINNPLSVISGKLTILKRKIEDPKFLEKGYLLGELEKIEKSTNQILNVTQGMKALMRDGTSDPVVPHSLNEIFKNLREVCQPNAKANQINLEIELPSAQLEVLCRPSQILQILVNLVNNSIDAVHAAEKDLKPELWIKVSATSLKNNELQVSVTDSGKGIPPQVRDHLFESFFTTKSAGKGTGLGLSLSRRIAEEHEGKLEIDTQCPNTRFVLSLKSPKN